MPLSHALALGLLALGLWLLKTAGRLVLEREYGSWAFALARLLINIGGVLCPSQRGQWSADLRYVQKEGFSGLPEAVSCLVSSPWLLLRRVLTKPATVVGVLLVVTLILIGGLELQLTRRELNSEIDRRLMAVATSFEQRVLGRSNRPDPSSAVTLWLSQQAFTDEQAAFATVGGVTFTRKGQTGPNLLASQDGVQLLNVTTKQWWTLPGGRDGRIRVFTVPIKMNGDYAGTLTLAASHSSVNRSMRVVTRAIVIASGIGFTFAILLGLIAGRRAVRRLSWPQVEGSPGLAEAVLSERSPRLLRRRALMKAGGMAGVLFVVTSVVVAGLEFQLTRSALNAEMDRRLTAVARSFENGPAKILDQPSQVTPSRSDMQNPLVSVGVPVLSLNKHESSTVSPPPPTPDQTITEWLANQEIGDGQILISLKDRILSTGVAGIIPVRLPTVTQPVIGTARRWWTLPDGGGMRALTVPIHTNGPYAGTLTVAFSQSDVIRSTRALLRDVAIASCIGLGFAGLLGLVAMRRSSRLAWAGA